MPQVPKPISVIKAEGNRLKLSKKTIEHREKAEKTMDTGIKMRESAEVKANPLAHAEFIRLKRIWSMIGKDDALFETVLNRYCMILAEIKEYGLTRTSISNYLEDEKDTMKRMEMTQHIMRVDTKIAQLRKMAFDIERENIMTIAAGLRSIPKKAPKEEEDPMEKLLRG